MTTGHIKPEYFTFPGDERYDYTTVWHSHPGWLAIPGHAQNFARWCGLEEISKQTMERWWRLWAAVFYLDDLIDNCPLELRHLAGSVLERLLRDPDFDSTQLPQWANDDVITIVGLLRNSMNELGDEQWKQIVTYGLGIKDMGHAKVRESSLQKYLSIIQVEGRLTTSLLCACMNAQERRRRRRFRRFACAFGHLTTSAILYDHARDLAADYRDDLTSVYPTERAQKRIMASCLGEALKLGWHPRAALALTTVVLKNFRHNFPRLDPLCFWAEPEMQMVRRRQAVLESVE